MTQCKPLGNLIMKQTISQSHCAIDTSMPGDPVAIVRPHLRGSTLLVVGGDERADQLVRLRGQLGLRDAVWASTRDSDPTPRRFRSLIRDPRLTLVVLLEGLIRHQHARDVASLCEESGKPLVRIWRSPNPVAVAHAILSQASRRLALPIMN